MSERCRAWKVLPLGKAAPIDTQPVLPTDQPETEFNYIALENIESGTGRLLDLKPVRGAAIRSNKFVFDTVHVLLGKLRPYLNKVVVPNRPGICSTDILPLRPNKQWLCREWLAACLRSPEFIEYSRAKMDGAKMPRLRTPDLESFEIPVPPLTEQRRLVARIEALTSRLEQARKARQAALADSEAIKQAVWDRAFTNVPEDGWVPIGKHARVQGGYAFKSEWFVTEGIRLLRNQNVYHGTLEWSDTVHLPPDRRGEFADYELREGDVVISMDRPLIKAGLKAARVSKADLPCLLLQRVGRFLCDEELDRDYLLHFLFSQSFIPHISGDGRSCAVPHISAKQIEGIAMPLPKRKEQERVVAHLDAVEAKLAELRRLQAETEVELASFTPALLAKAFRGEI